MATTNVAIFFIFNYIFLYTMKSLFEFLINSKSTGIIKDPNFVDLGLDVLWAKCNIGAKEETDYGHYYQWGGLEPMDDKKCGWENTPFNDGYYCFNTKYFDSIKNNVAPRTTLSKDYDIAYQTYKDNKVHMPTDDEIYDLVDQTKQEWIENYNNSDINGVLLTGNNNTIFIPAAGYRCETKFNYKSFASIILSSCFYGANDALSWNAFFDNKNTYNTKMYQEPRCYGLPVRAVKDK